MENNLYVAELYGRDEQQHPNPAELCLMDLLKGDLHSGTANDAASDKGKSYYESYSYGFTLLQCLDASDRSNVEQLADAIVKDDRPTIQNIICRYASKPTWMSKLYRAVEAKLAEIVLGTDPANRNLLLTDKGYDVSFFWYGINESPNRPVFGVRNPANGRPGPRQLYPVDRNCASPIS
jgi:hypothetical protein